MLCLLMIAVLALVITGYNKNLETANFAPNGLFSKFVATKGTSLMRGPCQPKTNLSFIKIHRAGSGTFHNVLVRFAITHGTFLALSTCPYFDCYPRTLSELEFRPRPWHDNFTGYNMYIDHVRYDHDATFSILPENTVIITQIREPLSHTKAYEQKICRHASFKSLRNKGIKYKCGQNNNAFVLGYNKPALNNITDFRLYLDTLDKQLFHVNILEYLDESLVLLKRKMCWEMKDILHFGIHIHGSGKINKINATIEEQKIAHRKVSPLDYDLYDFFYERQKREIKSHGTLFQEEVEEFLKVGKRFQDFCDGFCSDFNRLSSRSPAALRDLFTNTSIRFTPTQFYDSFSLTYTDCAMLKLVEIIIKRILIYQMYPELCRKNSKLARKLNIPCDTENYVIPGLVRESIEGDILRKC